mmetsp:Transcript_69337/g.195553  ORF Transcript_69337/g.195553 Transcript_69337/m.195553 type:complete len:240 (-) Transcript_69337:35-754(-)
MLIAEMPARAPNVAEMPAPARVGIIVAERDAARAMGAPALVCARLNRSRPNCTPPYTPMLPPARAAALPSSTILSSSMWIWERKRSLQSWGTSRPQPPPASGAGPNHASSSGTSPSIRNFASTDALASSRRWYTTLFLSAMRSKKCVKALAYCTRGWSGLVIGASSMPPLPLTCSRASTPISARGMRTLPSASRTSAFLTTNHSRARHSSPPSAAGTSKQLFMPTTGCWHSPMASSFRW